MYVWGWFLGMGVLSLFPLPPAPPPVGVISPWNPTIMQGTSAAPPPLWAGDGGLVFVESFMHVPT